MSVLAAKKALRLVAHRFHTAHNKDLAAEQLYMAARSLAYAELIEIADSRGERGVYKALETLIAALDGKEAA